jgi:tRNA (guanosine-2'-O-)-methyltransferase
MMKRMDADVQQAAIDYLAQFVTERRQRRMEEVLDRRTRYLTVVLEDVYQPHNASAVLRSCEIFGVQDLHVVERQNAFRPNRDIALGAGQWLTLHHYREEEGQVSGTRRALQTLREQGYHVAAMTLREESMLLDDLELSQPVALCFGSEETGLSEEAHALADSFVKLPMFGFTRSFNISVTAALALNALTRRLHGSDLDWHLDEEERRALKLEWLAQSTRGGALLLQNFLESQDER